MADPIIDSQTNSLSYLIPTGEQDIAVRELLIKIFGDAISCKVPGASCGAETVNDPGLVASTVFSVFNGGTLVFVTILLIFIGLMGFIKTAQDGEFFGKSWNTTFTALRLLAGVAFILPMPNSYSTIQNFTMYVALWSSGLANEGNKAVSDHYLRRLASSMINQTPNATSIRNEAQDILVMHTCASLINKQYAGQARLQYETSNLGGSDRVEFAYVERGNYLTPGSTPCGRLVIRPLGSISAEGNVPTKDVWNAALGADPLTSKARKKMAEAAEVLAASARDAKITVIKGLMSDLGNLRILADDIVDKFSAGNITYDPATGGIQSAPQPSGSTQLPDVESATYLKRYATIVRNADSSLNSSIESARQSLMSGARSDGSGGFLVEAKEMLQKGGWMSAATTYRSMLDMVSIQFIGDKQAPYKIEGRDELQGALSSSPGGVYQQVTSLRTWVSWLLDSDTGKQVISDALSRNGTAPLVSPIVNEASLQKLATGKLSTSEIMETLYGTNTVNGYRNSIIKSMAISGEYDPLYQLKVIGDATTAVAETFVAAELGFRVAVALSSTALGVASKNILGRAVDFVTGFGAAGEKIIAAAQYVAEQFFAIMKVLVTALVALGYMFSTWLPAIPFLAFLLAQLGWLFGLVMTLFAMNIWGVMHTTPARNDSFIGSEAQGYLLLVSLFFRPIIAVSALSLSYIIAPPVMKLINMTLLPMMYASNVSTNTLSVITATLFGMVLYFTVVKGVLLMVYMIPQSFPDEVMRIISAGIGDLGQSRALSTMETSEGSARTAMGTMGHMNQASGEGFKATLERRRKAAEAKRESARQAENTISGASTETPAIPDRKR